MYGFKISDAKVAGICVKHSCLPLICVKREKQRGGEKVAAFVLIDDNTTKVGVIDVGRHSDNQRSKVVLFLFLPVIIKILIIIEPAILFGRLAFRVKSYQAARLRHKDRVLLHFVKSLL